MTGTRIGAMALAGLTASVVTGIALAGAQAQTVQLSALGVYETGKFNVTAAEIAAFDSKTKRVFVTNSADDSLDVLDASNPSSPTKIRSLDLTPFGGDPTSVDVDRGRVAVAVVATPKTLPGKVVFFETRGTNQLLGSVQVGALPDMVTFTPNGRRLLVANEGEPETYLPQPSLANDPVGSISIVELRGGGDDDDDFDLDDAVVRTAGFESIGPLEPGVRVFGPGASVAQDLEPEYIALSDDGRRAWVTLQEANAIAEVDVSRARVVAVHALGFKNHLLPGNALDPSDRDGVSPPANPPAVKIANWPVLGMYQPDAITSYRVRGKTYLVMANEGDVRADWPGFTEEIRVGSGSYVLEPSVFPNAATLKQTANLGRLTVSSATGDTDGDGDFDQIHAYGARSLSIRETDGDLVWDSGDTLEQRTAIPGEFNSTNSANGSWDTRSDDKGPEPEGVAVGRIGERWYAFLGLERIGGVAVFDITRPSAPTFVQHLNTRDFAAGTPQAAGDLGPEGIAFVPRSASPTKRPLLVVTNEISGSTRFLDVSVLGGGGDDDDDDDDEDDDDEDDD
jgi:hypothetical protein